MFLSIKEGVYKVPEARLPSLNLVTMSNYIADRAVLNGAHAFNSVQAPDLVRASNIFVDLRYPNSNFK